MSDADRRLLVVAYYFPPMGLSGVQRIARFVKYLPEFGWRPEVLTVDPAGYFAYDASLLDELTARGIPIHRTGSLDPTRLFGRRRVVRLPDEPTRRRFSAWSHWLFVPDNKIGWMPAALRRGRQLLEVTAFDAILATAPPYTSTLIGRRLAAATVPLVLDFRDDWLGNPRHIYPTLLHRRLHGRLERRALQAATRVITINERIRDAMWSRHRDAVPPDSFVVLPQGYDAEDFAGPAPSRSEGRCLFVYSGVFYDRQSPDTFLKALARVVARHPAWRERVCARFVGLLPAYVTGLARSLGIEDIIEATGYLPHSEVILHLRAADVLWLTVGPGPGQEQISTSKLYEYFGTDRPILGLVPDGAARDALLADGASLVVPPDEVGAVADAIERLVRLHGEGALPQPPPASRSRYDRRRLTAELAAHLNAAVSTLGGGAK
jgi:glycosyltransferase involved in cell wall biosynthesis